MNTKSLAIAALLTLVALLTFGNVSAVGMQKSAVLPVLIAQTSEIIAEGRVEPAHFVDISLGASGTVGEVLGKEGDRVQAGQVIARLQNSNAQTLEEAQTNASLELGNAYQALKDAQSKLDDVDIPAKFSGMTAADAAHLALDNLHAARKDFAPYEQDSRKKLAPNHFFPSLPKWIRFDFGSYTGLAKEYKKRVDVAWVDYRRVCTWLYYESAVETAKARIAQAQYDYDSLQDPAFAEDTAGVRAALANAEVRAPFAGIITNLDLKAGEYVTTGQTVATIADLSGWVVKTTDLTEIDVVHIQEGQRVQVTLDAIQGLALKGNVLSIA